MGIRSLITRKSISMQIFIYLYCTHMSLLRIYLCAFHTNIERKYSSGWIIYIRLGSLGNSFTTLVIIDPGVNGRLLLHVMPSGHCFSFPLCFYIYSLFSSHILLPFQCLISLFLFPCSSVWENTRA